MKPKHDRSRSGGLRQCLVLGTLFAGQVLAQTNDVWFFGGNAGIDFSTGSPIAATSPLVALEGTACMSDQGGNLLFYTNGITLWDRDHQPMPNGAGLLGGASSTQAALVLPLPGSCGVYYVFTTSDHYQSGDLRYSVVDMCLNNGFGDVVPGQKNVLLAPSMSEKLTAVKHSNGTDAWILAYQKGGNGFFAYLLGSAGLQAAPVVSNVGPSFGNGDCVIGPMKASHDGTRLVLSSSFCNRCQMVDFDPSTGVVSGPVDLTATLALPGGIYGIEFSPDGEVLYLASFWGLSRLYQIELASMSMIMLSSAPGNYTYGALQLASDGRVYMARQGQAFVDVIQEPNVVGTGCGYQTPGFSLLPGTVSDIGMPNIAPFLVLTDPSLNVLSVDLGPDTLNCVNMPLELSVNATCDASVIWQDGSVDDTYVITEPGVYWVEVTSGCGMGSDTVVVLGSSIFSAQDTVVCAGTDLILSVGTGWTDVLWSDGSSSNTLLVTSPGQYGVQVSAPGCDASDSILVSFIDPPVVDLGPDLAVCDVSGAVLSTGLVGLPHLWQDGSTDEVVIVSQSGTYWVDVGPAGCSASDTVVVVVFPTPVVDLGADTVLCSSEVLELTANLTGGTAIWQDGSMASTYTATTTGTYWVTVDDQGCMASDTISVNYIDPPLVDLGPDLAVCDVSGAVLSTGLVGLPHLWQDGSTDEEVIVSQSGTYWVDVGPAGCSASDTVVVVVFPTPVVDLGADTVLCSSEVLELTADLAGGTAIWQDGSMASTYTATTTGTYWVSVDDQGCTASDTISVNFIDTPLVDLGPDITICEGGAFTLDTGLPGLPHLWQDGATESIYSSSMGGIVWVLVGPDGCTGSDTVLVAVLTQPVVDLGPDRVVCGDVELELASGYPASNSTWQDGTTASVYLATGPGTYSVVVDLEGCVDSSSVMITSAEWPVLVLPGDTVLCDAGPITINAVVAVGDTVVWQDGTMGASYQVDGPGIYVAMVTNVCGTVQDSVRVALAPLFDPPVEVSICAGELAAVNWSDRVSTIDWSNGGSSPVGSFPEGAYGFTAIDHAGCPRQGVLQVVWDAASDGVVYVPNVFTPDGDGLNELFLVVGADQADFRLEIFNRWGELLYVSTDPQQGWDGRHGGRNVPDGTYVYVLTHRSNCDGIGLATKVGHVTVLR